MESGKENFEEAITKRGKKDRKLQKEKN